LEEYITKGDNYVDWVQWAVAEESENLKGCSVNVPVFNPMHLNHENMQQVVSFRDERWDEIRSSLTRP
jgi:hypothetical protein